jgi:amidase
MRDEFAWLDATAQAELVRRREVTALELVDAAIARIERLNPALNAVISPTFDKAREAARLGKLGDGPFRGVPIVVKDFLCETAGDPYYQGSKFLRDLKWKADSDSYLAQKFRAAGFAFLGRTNLPELANSMTTEPLAFGPTRNPWNRDCSAGGSSGGSCAAVAAGMVAVAHANDGGGSTRIPASMCGLVGLKPSRGRLSKGPKLGEGVGGFGVEGVVSRTVRDTASILDLIGRPMPGDPCVAPPPARPYVQELAARPAALRIGMLNALPEGRIELHHECREAVERAARLLESLGHKVEESHPQALFEPDEKSLVLKLRCAEVAARLDAMSRMAGREVGPDDVEPATWAFAERGRALGAGVVFEAISFIEARSRRIASWWADGFDVLLTPTLAQPPPRLGSLVGTKEKPLQWMNNAMAYIVFTVAFNQTGQPAISLPLYWNQSGLPIGVQLAAAYGREDLLLRIAAQLEQAAPWAERRPPVAA